MDTPRYQHDCTSCIFLGQYNEFDLYFCGTQMVGGSTVIARFSDYGPDYQSGLIFGQQRIIPELTEAYDRAVARGLLKLPCT